MLATLFEGVWGRWRGPGDGGQAMGGGVSSLRMSNVILVTLDHKQICFISEG